MAQLLKIYEKILGLVYPKRCLLCDEALSYEAKPGVCPDCRGKVMFLTMCICRVCGKPHIDPEEDLCYDCNKKAHHFKQGRSLWVYEGEVRKAIHRYKYQRRKALGKGFAQELYRFYIKQIHWDIDIITSVPLHPKRLQERSFNQSAYVAQLFGQHVGIEVNNDLLLRTKYTRPQKDLSDLERISNVENAFKFNSKYRCHGKNVLIIDDIYTTGNTMDRCSEKLTMQGAKNVYFLALAIGNGF